MRRLNILTAVLFLFNAEAGSQPPCNLPAVLFPDDTVVVCTGSTFILTAPALTGSSYTWSTNEATQAINIPYSGIYWLTVTNGTCTVTDTITILFNSFLLAPVTEDVFLCKGRFASALAVPGQNLLWYNSPVGGAGSSIAPVPSVSDTGRTAYWVSQTIRGCESPRSLLTVKVIDKPFFELGKAFIIPCMTEGIVLQVIPGEGTSYNWSNGSHESSILAGQRGTYWLYAENMCGNHSDTVIAVECHDKCVQTPTAFTPNSDGKNDLFSAACFCPVSKYNLSVYNRNGEKVFETTTPGAGWNGIFNGKSQPVGAYVYMTSYYDFVLKQNRSEKGIFVLLR